MNNLTFIFSHVIEGVTRLLLENLQLQNEEEDAAANRKVISV